MQSAQKGGETKAEKADKDATRTMLKLEGDQLVVASVEAKVGLRLGVALKGHSTKAGGEKKLNLKALGLRPGDTIAAIGC